MSGFTQIATNWDSLTNDQRIAALKQTNGVIPSIADIESLPQPVKIIYYIESDTTPSQPVLTLNAVPQDQFVRYNGLFDIMDVQNITAFNLTNTITDSSTAALIDPNGFFFSIHGEEDSAIYDSANHKFTVNPTYLKAYGVGPYGNAIAMDFYAANSGTWPINDTANSLAYIDFNTSWTFSCWLQPTSGLTGSPVIYEATNGTTNLFTFYLFQTSGNMKIYIYGLATTTYDTGYTLPIDGNWHHVGLAFDSSTNTLKMFADGLLKYSVVLTIPKPTSIFVAHARSYFGAYYMGYMDDLCLICGTDLFGMINNATPVTSYTIPTNYIQELNTNIHIMVINPYAKIIVTLDNITWWTCIGSTSGTKTWKQLPDISVSTIQKYGMDASWAASLTQADWAKLTVTTTVTNITDSNGNVVGTSTVIKYAETINFGYLLGVGQSSDVVSLDKLTLTANLKGTWKGAVNGTDYTFWYTNELLTVNILTAGDYIVNYVK